MNNDVSVNAFSSDSGKDVKAGGKRYTTEIAAVILLDVINSCSFLKVVPTQMQENAGYVISDI